MCIYWESTLEIDFRLKMGIRFWPHMSVASSVDLIKGKVSLVTEYHISIYLSIGIPAAGYGHQVRDAENAVRRQHCYVHSAAEVLHTLSAEQHRSSVTCITTYKIPQLRNPEHLTFLSGTDIENKLKSVQTSSSGLACNWHNTVWSKSVCYSTVAYPGVGQKGIFTMGKKM